LLTPPLTAGTPDEQLTATVRAGLRMALATSLLAVGDRPAAVAVVDAIIAGDLAKWPGVRAGIPGRADSSPSPLITWLVGLGTAARAPNVPLEAIASGGTAVHSRSHAVTTAPAQTQPTCRRAAMVRGECACALPGP